LQLFFSLYLLHFPPPSSQMWTKLAHYQMIAKTWFRNCTSFQYILRVSEFEAYIFKWFLRLIRARSFTTLSTRANIEPSCLVCTLTPSLFKTSVIHFSSHSRNVWVSQCYLAFRFLANIL
jgi:hypothetical protein